MNKIIKLFGITFLTLSLSVALCSCGAHICEKCEKSFSGASYYGLDGDETMCEDCAKEYWLPLSYKNYKN